MHKKSLTHQLQKKLHLNTSLSHSLTSLHAPRYKIMKIVHLQGSFILLQTHRCFRSPMFKTLTNALFRTVLQSNIIFFLLTSVTCSCVKNPLLQTIPKQVISNSFLLLPLPPCPSLPPPSTPLPWPPPPSTMVYQHGMKKKGLPIVCERVLCSLDGI